MNISQRIRRIAGVLAGLAGAMIGLAAFTPAAFARVVGRPECRPERPRASPRPRRRPPLQR